MAILLLILSLIFSPVEPGINCSNLSGQALRKMNKVLVATWPNESITCQAYRRSAFAEVFKDDKSELFRLQNENATIAYLLISRSFGKFEYFTYMILFSTSIEIMRVELLEYREDYGGEIGSKKWLRQFIGLNSTDQIVLGDQIQGISGATISCRSITAGIADACNGLQRLQSSHLLDNSNFE